MAKGIDLFSAGLATVQSALGAPATPTVSSVGEGGVSRTANSLLDWISRGADVYRDIKGADSIVPPNTPSGTTPGTPSTLANAKWLPWALGAGALLIIGLIFFRR